MKSVRIVVTNYPPIIALENPVINPDCPLEQKLVIPAQAGIQLIEWGYAGMGGILPNLQKIPRSRAISRFGRSSKLAAIGIGSFCPLREVYILLDSRLRGNDKANGSFELKTTSQVIPARQRHELLFCGHAREMACLRLLPGRFALTHRYRVLPRCDHDADVAINR